jgi:hypothetical protein
MKCVAEARQLDRPKTLDHELVEVELVALGVEADDIVSAKPPAA